MTVTPGTLTNQVPARFEFTADRDATFRCAVDDGPEADCTSPHLVTVDDGDHLLGIRVADAAGNTNRPKTETLLSLMVLSVGACAPRPSRP